MRAPDFICEHWLRFGEGCAVAAEREAGKTLADFAHSGKLFKRPMHGCAYGFDRSGYLKEYVNGGTYWPRLNVEDLTATDWEEVPW